MDKMIHTSLRAMQGIMDRQTAIAHNLANVDTTGFRAEVINAQSLYLQGDGLDSRVTTNEFMLDADMNAGSVKSTGRPLDVAVEGNALLTVQAPNGEEAYTRRGDLMLTDSGLLTNGEGHPVIGESGPITIPAADRIDIAPDGRISIVPVGGDPTKPQDIGRLKLASPVGSTIRKQADTLFHVPNNGALPADPNARLVVGALEGSNVNSTQALVDMIEASRAWETQVKLLTTAQELDTGGAQVMQMPV